MYEFAGAVGGVQIRNFEAKWSDQVLLMKDEI